MKKRKVGSVNDIKKYLYENAADYLNRSVKSYENEDFKAAIIYLWSSILLFLKIRLFEINPALIYASLNDIICFNKRDKKPMYKPFNLSGDKKTVDFKTIMERYHSLDPESCLFNFRQQLEKIRKARNRVEHYINDITSDDFQRMISSILPFLNQFIEDELGESIKSLISSWGALLEIDSFYKDRLVRMQEDMSSREYLAETRGLELKTFPCPSCTDGIMINEGDILICKICEEESSYRICEKCGEVYLYDDFMEKDAPILCEDCIDEIF